MVFIFTSLYKHHQSKGSRVKYRRVILPSNKNILHTFLDKFPTGNSLTGRLIAYGQTLLRKYTSTRRNRSLRGIDEGHFPTLLIISMHWLRLHNLPSMACFTLAIATSRVHNPTRKERKVHPLCFKTFLIVVNRLEYTILLGHCILFR